MLSVNLLLLWVAIIEIIANGSSTGNDELDVAATDAHAILKTHGYGDLESIPSRVARIQGEIEKALESKNYDALPRLGQEMKRAEAGKPPFATEKKPRKKKVKCGNVDCDWKGGVAVIGSACPVDGYLVVAQEG